MVPQAMADSQGVRPCLRANLSKVDELYLSKNTGITRNDKAEDIHFNLRQILVLSDKTADAECLDGLVHTTMVLYQDGQIATKDNVQTSESVRYRLYLPRRCRGHSACQAQLGYEFLGLATQWLPARLCHRFGERTDGCRGVTITV